LVGLYFNTKNMSAILKALQNRKVEVELKSEVVEFAGVKDIEKKLKQLNTNETNLNKAKNKRKAAQEIVDTEASNLKFAIEQSEEVLADFAKSAKDLGIEPNSINTYKELNGAINTSKGVLKNKDLNR
jgi:hypothetical protein